MIALLFVARIHKLNKYIHVDVMIQFFNQINKNSVSFGYFSRVRVWNKQCGGGMGCGGVGAGGWVRVWVR
jgi:hypothetical protein